MLVVTGANGFIGSALVWELNRARRTDIICVDPVSIAERPDLLARHKFEKFLNKSELLTWLSDQSNARQVEAVFHMGACSYTTELNVEYLNETNVQYTTLLWNWCTQHKVPFFYASSGAVYGDGALGFDDAQPTTRFHPLNPYGESKAAFDRWAEIQTATPPLWMGLRFFNVYGPNEYHKGFQGSVVGKAYDEIAKTGRLKLFRSHHKDYADGKQMRDFVFVKEITRWILEIFEHQAKMHSGIYNMGYGHARTWLDLANAVFNTMNVKTDIEWIDIPEIIRERYQYFTEAKMDRLLALGLNKPQWSLELGVEDYVQNYLAPRAQGRNGYL